MDEREMVELVEMVEDFDHDRPTIYLRDDVTGSEVDVANAELTRRGSNNRVVAVKGAEFVRGSWKIDRA